MDEQKARFLAAVLGVDGARALLKATQLSKALEHALIPRTILAWVGVAARASYEGALPGLDNTYVSIAKSERGFTGQVSISDTPYDFTNASLYHVASAVGVALGIDEDRVPGGVRDVELARLGKSIDLLVKARTATAQLLQKKTLDPALGYTFQHQNHDFTVAGMPAKRTVISAFTNAGHKVGEAEFLHDLDDNTMESIGTNVHPEHQRKGLASAMYAHAQNITGALPKPSSAQSPEGKALWSGNASQKQFGMAKVELPGQTAKPTAASAPTEATPPSRQERQPPAQKQKPKLPHPPKTLAAIPKIPGVQPLKLSERQLRRACPACGGNLLKGEAFVGCMCWRDLAKTAKLTKTEDGYELALGKNWDAEAIETFVESMGTA